MGELVDIGVSRVGGARPRASLIVAYIDDHRTRFEVEPICRVLSEHGTRMPRAPIEPTSSSASRRPPGRRPMANPPSESGGRANRSIYGAES